MVYFLSAKFIGTKNIKNIVEIKIKIKILKIPTNIESIFLVNLVARFNDFEVITTSENNTSNIPKKLLIKIKKYKLNKLIANRNIIDMLNFLII